MTEITNKYIAIHSQLPLTTEAAKLVGEGEYIYLSQTRGVLKAFMVCTWLWGRRFCLQPIQQKDPQGSSEFSFTPDPRGHIVGQAQVGLQSPQPIPPSLGLALSPKEYFQLPRPHRAAVLFCLFCCSSALTAPTPRSSCFPALPGIDLAVASGPLKLSPSHGKA